MPRPAPGARTRAPRGRRANCRAVRTPVCRIGAESSKGVRGNVLASMPQRLLPLLIPALWGLSAVAQPPPAATTPALAFRDVAREAGVEFEHENSPTPRKHLIETMPGGLARFDYDADVFFTNGAGIPDLVKSSPRHSNRLLPYGYASASAGPLHFGTGQAKTIDRVEIRWPSGTLQVLENVAADQVLTVREAP